MSDLHYATVLEEVAGNTLTEDMDFTGIVPSGVTVSSVVNTVYNAAGTTTTGVVTGSSLSTPVATLTIVCGSTEQSYLIKCVATGSNSKTYTLTKLLNVYLPGVYR
jgi:hypothetical protein